ncbi:MAG: hypothetical protein MH321_17160 [Leptospiraceae bacterium]|nr:hypothetical protein [Leptospiraceae bacterium]
MSSGSSLPEDSRTFFEKKYKLKYLLEEYEKRILDATEILNETISIASEMETIANKRKAYYYLHRTRRLSLQLDDLKEAKGYERKEFDFVYKLLDKIDESESSDFLDSVLRGSMEKVARGLRAQSLNEEATPKSDNKKKSYFTFHYKNVYFIAPKYPKKLVQNIDPHKTSVRIGNRKWEIHPGKFFGLNEEQDFPEATHLCILKKSAEDTENTYRCFYYHSMDREVKFDEANLKSRLKTIEPNSSSFIKYYFRYAGKNYYYIDF